MQWALFPCRNATALVDEQQWEKAQKVLRTLVRQAEQVCHVYAISMVGRIGQIQLQLGSWEGREDLEELNEGRGSVGM